MTRLTADRARTTRPLRSTRITRLHRYYETLRPCAPHRYSTPHGFSRLRPSRPPTTVGPHCATGRPRTRDDRFTRSAQEPKPSSRHLHAGHRLANQQAPARLIPEPKRFPVSMSPICFRRFISGSLTLAFLALTRRAHGATFPTTLTTTALDRSSSGWFAAIPCRTTAEDHQTYRPSSSISCTAPHLVIWSSTSSLLQRSCSHLFARSRSVAPTRVDARFSSDGGARRLRRSHPG
jgi:hypothetical protein